MLSRSQVKYIQSLGQKKFRDEEGLFIAEGPKIIEELLVSASNPVQQIYALPGWITAHQGLLKSITPVEVDEKELERVSHLNTPNQVLAIVKKFETPLKPEIKGKVSLVLDTIQDPGNLGTIIRIADWFGIEQIICSPECADMYNPKVVQSTVGSITRVKMIYTDLVQWVSSQKDIRIYASALNGRDVTMMNKITEGLIIIGNESKGIRPALFELANVKIHIPQKGKAESLNAAVATGIIVSHLV
jgi:TrmH family RNA methyltransferase